MTWLEFLIKKFTSSEDINSSTGVVWITVVLFAWFLECQLMHIMKPIHLHYMDSQMDYFSKNLRLCSSEEGKSNMFGTGWAWVNNIFLWEIFHFMVKYTFKLRYTSSCFLWEYLFICFKYRLRRCWDVSKGSLSPLNSSTGSEMTGNRLKLNSRELLLRETCLETDSRYVCVCLQIIIIFLEDINAANYEQAIFCGWSCEFEIPQSTSKLYCTCRVSGIAVCSGESCQDKAASVFFLSLQVAQSSSLTDREQEQIRILNLENTIEMVQH